MGNPAYLKKGVIRRQEGPSLPHPQYSLTGFNWGIGRKFQRFGEYPNPNRGRHSGGAGPREHDEYWNNLIRKIDLGGFQKYEKERKR